MENCFANVCIMGNIADGFSWGLLKIMNWWKILRTECKTGRIRNLNRQICPALVQNAFLRKEMTIATSPVLLQLELECKTEYNILSRPYVQLASYRQEKLCQDFSWLLQAFSAWYYENSIPQSPDCNSLPRQWKLQAMRKCQRQPGIRKRFEPPPISGCLQNAFAWPGKTQSGFSKLSKGSRE